MTFEEYLRQQHRDAFEERMLNEYQSHVISDIIDNLDDQLMTGESGYPIILYLDAILHMSDENLKNYDSTGLVKISILEKIVDALSGDDECIKTAKFLMHHPLSIDERFGTFMGLTTSTAEELRAAEIICMSKHQCFNNVEACTELLYASYGMIGQGRRVLLSKVEEYSNKSGLLLGVNEIVERVKASTQWLERDRNVSLIHLLNKNPVAMSWFVRLSNGHSGNTPLICSVAGNCETANIAAKDIQAIMSALLYLAQKTQDESQHWQICLKMGLTACRDKYEERTFPGVVEYLRETADPRLVFLSHFAGLKSAEKINMLTKFVKDNGIEDFSDKVIKVSQRSTVIKNKLRAMISSPEGFNKSKALRNAIENELGI